MVFPDGFIDDLLEAGQCDANHAAWRLLRMPVLERYRVRQVIHDVGRLTDTQLLDLKLQLGERDIARYIDLVQNAVNRRADRELPVSAKSPTHVVLAGDQTIHIEVLVALSLGQRFGVFHSAL